MSILGHTGTCVADGFTATWHEADGIWTVRITGRLCLGHGRAAFDDLARQVAERGESLILDVRGLAKLDSSGLGSLVGVVALFRGKVRFVNFHPQIYDLLASCKLLAVLPRADDERIARAELDSIASPFVSG